jgi:phosphoglycolate phosphatase-like HAD superfamily hydrolase
MLLGIDLDNTLIRYDRAFCQAAADRGLVPAGQVQTKNGVRDRLRAAGMEPAWTALQGEVYGPRITEAELFEGALACLRWARESGFRLCIISHKTRHPIVGERHDLHLAARRWLAHAGLSGVAGAPVPEDDVLFAERKEDKIAAIAARGCDVFVDDLPEILRHPAFPRATRGVLFDPEQAFAAWDGLRLSSWGAIQTWLATL